MHILKKLFRGLSSQTLKFALFFTAMSAATVAILGSPAPIKQTLHDSGLYTKVVPSVLENAKQEQAKKQTQNQPGEGGDIDLNDSLIKKAVEDALPATFIEQNVNSALDGIFDWLNGKTETPQVTIDLTGPKQKLATGIGEAAYAKAAAKPTCTYAQLRTMDRNNIDVFEVPCIPPGVDLKAEQAKLVNKMLTSGEFLKDTTLSANDLKIGTKDDVVSLYPTVPFYENDTIAKAPVAFKIFSSSAVIWGVVALIAGAVFVLLNDDRKRGIWRVGRALLTVGVVVIAFAIVANYLSGQVKPTVENENDLILLVPGIIKDIVGQFTKVLYIFGGVYIVIGAGTMITFRTKKSESVATSSAKKPAPKPKR